MPATAESKQPKWRIWLTAYAPFIIWVFVVLGLGSGIGSMKETSRIIRPLLEFLFPTASPETLTFYHGIIRKFAHLTEYAMLAFLAVRALRASSVTSLRNYRCVIAISIVLVIASLDEFHQSFEASRTSALRDVFLDLIGGSITTAMMYIHARRKAGQNDRLL
jgi:VanZ family protein